MTMPTVILAIIALVGAAIHIRRHRDQDRLAVDTFFIWWMVAAIGIGSILGAMFHVFDGKEVAEGIGFTRGDGGFQFENAMGDLAIGVAGVLCFRFKGLFWLATVIMMSIQYLGDAGGHIYFWLAEDNTQPDNVGVPLVFDFVGPLLAIALLHASWRRGGLARPQQQQQQPAAQYVEA